MEPNKKGVSDESFTPVQNLILKLLKWSAWTASAVAMVYAMHF